jgi:hypothetical protein
MMALSVASTGLPPFGSRDQRYKVEGLSSFFPLPLLGGGEVQVRGRAIIGLGV